jgi:membrane-bound lytic murein transglycosylase MltF
VDFSEPTLQNVRHIVVTGPGVPPLATVDDLSGREVHVRRSSSYYDDLTALNARFKSAGKPPVRIVPVDEVLEDEDVLQMVDAGILPITITKTLYGEFWKQIYDQLTVYDNLTVREGADVAWAIRRDSPQLKKVVNDFVRTHRAGTVFGNVMLKRYLGSAKRLQNPASEEDLKRFRAAAASLKKYAGQYDFDWLVIAAQAYQESRINQSLKSSAGAVGVMQIKPSTAAEVGVQNVNELDSNVHAGVKYIRFLVDRYYKDEPMDRLNRGLFAFASYNAGPAKVRKMRAKAKEMGLNPNVWFNNVELVAGEVIGRETVDYVSNIYKYYTAYKAIEAQRGLRSRRAATAPASGSQ